MKNLFSSLSITGGWGTFVHQNQPKPNLAVIQPGPELQQEVVAEVKSVEKDTETALNSASTEVELAEVAENTAITSTETVAPAEEIAPVEAEIQNRPRCFEYMKRKQVRALFRNYAQNLDGKQWYDEKTGENLVVQTFVPKRWFTFKRPKIEIIRMDRDGQLLSKKEIILGRGNRIIENQYTKAVQSSRKTTDKESKDFYKHNTETDVSVQNSKQPIITGKNLINKTVTKEKIYWAQDKDEKVVTKIKEKAEARAVFQKLEDMKNETPDSAPREWCGFLPEADVSIKTEEAEKDPGQTKTSEAPVDQAETPTV